MSPQPTTVRSSSRAAAALLAAACLAAPGLAGAQTLTIATGTDPTGTPATVCPGGAATVVDAFTLTAAGTADVVSRITVTLSPAGAWANVGLVEILNASSAVLGSAIPGGDQVSVYTGALAVPIGTSSFTIRLTPRAHAAMPPPRLGQLFTVGATVTSVASNNPRAGADATSFSVNLDNAPSPEVALTTVSAGATTVSLGWAASTPVVVLRRASGTIVDTPVDGTSYAVGLFPSGTATVAFVGTAAGLADAGLTTGVGYYYKVFTVDACLNYSLGQTVGPIFPGGSNEGDTTAGSLKPVVGVINPMAGAILTRNAAGFRVQVRAFSPRNAGATQPLTSVRLKAATGAATFGNTACDAASYPIALQQNARYPNTATDAAIYEPTLQTDITALAAGAYVLRACAQNASGIVISSAVPVEIKAGTPGFRGDGNLLVRDNSAQLCSDCHAIQTHSSEATGSKYGSWYMDCRDCHQPHNTSNVGLIRPQITPPAVTGPQVPHTVVFSNLNTGFTPSSSKTANQAAAGFANGDGSGVCQVCHTRTTVFRNDGSNTTHQLASQACTDCHAHEKGLSASCTTCHGNPGLIGIGGADSLVNAAPPHDAAGGTLASLRTVGAHQAHVNRATYRTFPIQCNECHPIPQAHVTPLASGTATILFGALASVGTSPLYLKAATSSCSATYCHGASLSAGGTNTAPAWNAGQTMSCTTCHGSPPPLSTTSPHPLNPACATCHGAGYGPSAVSATALATHLNGSINVVTSGCTACHGDLAVANVRLGNLLVDAAPGATASATSVDAAGASVTTVNGVGAHRGHLFKTNYRAAPVACTECHTLPPSDADTSHASGVGSGGARATLKFGPLSNGTLVGWSAATVPSYAGSASGAGGTAGGSCAATYCHGGFRNGGSATPAWTGAFGPTTSSLACNACHGLPPAGGHVSDPLCSKCHPSYPNNPTAATVLPAAALAFHINGSLDVANMTCSTCHGNSTRNAVASAFATLDALGATLVKAAPPVDHNAVTVSPRVGAHQQHVNQGATAPAWSNALACSNCHLVPVSISHSNGTSDVVFSGIAAAAGATYSKASYTCASTYCHGNFPGGASAAIAWGTGTLAKLTCSSCHGNPPMPSATIHHPANPTCGTCHPGYTSGSVTAATHVDGTVQVTRSGCTSCHGTTGRAGAVAGTDANLAAAPAVDSRGFSLTTARGVGAHQSHLNKANFRSTALACSECHFGFVPTAGDVSHANGTTSLAAGTLARSNYFGTSPTLSWNGTNCSSTYCHGNITNGLNASPAWTGTFTLTGTGTTLGCTSCHGLPPKTTAQGGTHSTSTACGSCHPNYPNNPTAATVLPAAALAFHINGSLDVANMTCSGCHGNSTRNAVASAFATLDALGATLVKAAPPVDHNAVTVSPRVGAHQQHVNQGATAPAWSNALACSNCHLVPVSISHSNGTSDVVFSGIAAAAGATYSKASYTCASTYCHGNFPGGASAAIAWGTGTLAKLTCSSCHGNPPMPSATIHHPANPTCGTCHPGYTSGSVTAATHVDGTVQVTRSGCTSCHGTTGRAGAVAGTDANLAAAPAADSRGFSLTTARGVGAHQSHLNKANFRSTALTCSECHFGFVPTAGDVSHANGTTSLAAGTLARSNYFGTSPTLSWNGTNCSSTYCHGNITNGLNASPAWTGTFTLTGTGTTLGCTSCHGLPPKTTAQGGTHSTSTACGSCHPNYPNNPTAATVLPAAALAFHINGSLDVANMTCSGCHGNSTRNAVASAFATLDALGATLVKAAPPVDHNAVTVSPRVGAHQQHVNQGATAPAWSNALACSNCHLVPVSISHSNGTSDVVFSGIAAAAGATYSKASYTCASTYCHGNFPGGASAAIAWGTGTLAKLTCSSCHGNPPMPSATIHHPANPTCGTCHPGYTSGSVTAATHVDGTVQVTRSGCTSCHGTTGRAGAVAGTDANLAAAPAADSRGFSLTTARGVGAHQSHLNKANFRSTALTCSECHYNAVPAAGNVSHANGTTVVLGGLLATANNLGAWPATTLTWNGATCSNTYCHGNIPNGKKAAPAWTGTFTLTGTGTTLLCDSCHGLPPTTTAAGGTHPAAVTECASCHGAGYPTTLPTSATTFGGAPPANHLNGEQNGGGESTGGSACSGCHGKIYSGMLTTASTSVSKHTLASDGAGDTAVTWAAPLNTSVPAAQRSCVNMCHSDHPHDVPATSTTHEYNLYASPTSQANRNAASRTTATRARSDFDPATGTGMCAKCHANAIATGRQVVTEAGFAVAAHNGTTTNNGTTTSTWQYLQHDGGVTLRNCTKCHASRAEGQSPSVSASGGVTAVHFATDPKLLGGTINPGSAANSTRPAAFVCYNCHGDGTGNTRQLVNRNVWAVTGAKAFAHPVNMDTRHDTNAEAAAAFNVSFSGTTNRHVNCLDCHDSHAAGRTKVNRAATATGARNRIPAGSPLSGADGINVTSWPVLPAACSAAPTGPNTCWPATNSTNYAATLATATYEWQVCFKCHSNYGLGAPATSGTYPIANVAYASGMEATDLAREFSPANRSGHPVVTGLNHYTGSTAKALAATQLLAPWNTNMGEQTMLCTDCHNTDAAAPAVQGPHGSAVRFMLAGTNKAWPYNVAGATSGTLIRVSTSETNLGTTNGLFCRNCHPQQNSTASNSLHRLSDISGGQHGSQGCTFCHIRVPHGGKVTRLIVTSNAPARYKGPTIAMAQFTKLSKDTYTQNNVMTSACGTHTKVAGESW